MITYIQLTFWLSTFLCRFWILCTFWGVFLGRNITYWNRKKIDIYKMSLACYIDTQGGPIKRSTFEHILVPFFAYTRVQNDVWGSNYHYFLSKLQLNLRNSREHPTKKNRHSFIAISKRYSWNLIFSIVNNYSDNLFLLCKVHVRYH